MIRFILFMLALCVPAQSIAGSNVLIEWQALDGFDYYVVTHSGFTNGMTITDEAQAIITLNDGYYLIEIEAAKGDVLKKIETRGLTVGESI